MSNHDHSWRYGRHIFYSLTMSLLCALLSFVGLLVLGPQFVSGENLEALGLRWWFGLPVILLVGAAGVVTYRWFDQTNGWPLSLLIYIATVVLFTTLGIAVAWSVQVLIWQ